MLVARRRYRRRRACVVAAQRRVRTYLAIRDMERLAWRALQTRRWEATALLQRVWRGYKGRRRATLFRKIQHAKYARKGQTSAQFLLRRRLLRLGAALLVQRWIRPILQRSRMQPIHAWRVHQAHLCVQRYVKAWLARVLAARARKRLVEAAQDIERVFRGHRGRSRVRGIILSRRQLFAAICMQSIVRGFLARCCRRRYLQESSGAALKIQKTYRGMQGRQIAAIERAKCKLLARDKYKASLLSKLDLKLEMRERKFFLKRQIELMEVSHKSLRRRRVGYEKKMVDVRKHRAWMWSRANEVVAETYKLKRNLVGASENVYVTKLELDADIARRSELTAELTQLHVKLMAFKQMLREKIDEVRVMDPEEFWDIAARTAIFDGMEPVAPLEA
ncbi:Aste57867_20903 [Aphanomyces stellatus]|uniref:Aste57867_20903 protein n=1 Tax=Aphanomyces stellatus TaxID=120398 RepID=A0A485LG39_9STRA|nr:hypothetical protein As57867_020835 [Aphanomyces stellatus]VFT97580.1 Aste57867_20903 [Aphanomyces stellatus]